MLLHYIISKVDFNSGYDNISNSSYMREHMDRLICQGEENWEMCHNYVIEKHQT